MQVCAWHSCASSVAMARVPADETAFAHRQRRILVNVAAFYDGRLDKPIRETWTKTFASALD
jgi:hypothetical protein